MSVLFVPVSLRPGVLGACLLAVVLGMLGALGAGLQVSPVIDTLFDTTASGRVGAGLLQIRTLCYALLGTSHILSGMGLSGAAIGTAVWALRAGDTRPLAHVAAACVVHLVVYGLLWTPVRAVLDLTVAIGRLSAVHGAQLDLMSFVVTIVFGLALTMVSIVGWAAIAVTQDRTA